MIPIRYHRLKLVHLSRKLIFFQISTSRIHILDISEKGPFGGENEEYRALHPAEDLSCSRGGTVLPSEEKTNSNVKMDVSHLDESVPIKNGTPLRKRKALLKDFRDLKCIII